MNGDPGPARPAEFPPEWAKWVALAAFTILVAIGLAG